MIELFVASFVAGVLTTLAPCILPLLPVVIGGRSLHQTESEKVSLKHPLVIIGSLVLSIVIFTLLLKSTSALLGVPVAVWATISGGIIFLFGINMLFPVIWEKFMVKTNLALVANRLMGESQARSGYSKDVLLGFALGPVFNSCSPTYALIVAVVLPVSFVAGLGYLFAYALGLGLMLLLISVFGHVLVDKIKWMSDPRGVFQKSVGVFFVIIGLFVIFGVDKKVQTFVLENGWYDPIMVIEESLQ